MANKSTVGQLNVVLALDSAQFDTNLTRSRTRLREAEGGFAASGSRMASSLLGVSAGALVAGVSVAALGRALIGTAMATAQWADDLDAAATRIGVTAEQLQELRHAGEATDITTDKLDQGLRNLNATLGAMQTGVGNARLKDAFKYLDITPGQLAHMDNAAQLLPLLADRISRLGTQAEQAAIAKRLKIEDLLPLLQRGGEGVRALTAEMQNLGELSNDEVTTAADLNEEMRQAEMRFDNAKRSLTLGLLPAITWLVKLLGDAAQGWRGLFDNATMHNLAVVQADAQKTSDEKARLHYQRELAGNPSAARHAQIESELRAIDARVANANRVIMTGPQQSSGPRAADHVTADPELAGSGGRAARGPSAEEVRKAALLKDAEAASAKTQEGKRVTEEALVAAKTEQAAMQEKLATSEREAAEAAKEEAAAVSEKIARGQAAITDKTKQGLIDAAAAAAELAQTAHDALASSIEDALYAAADGNLFDYFAKRLKQALIGNIADALATAFTGGGSGGLGANGGLLAFGAHLLGLPGFANGGSIKVGGAGGTDSQLVAFRATPGELVSINPPGNDNGGVVVVHVDKSPLFDVHVRRAAAGDIAAMGSAAVSGGADLALGQLAAHQQNRVF